MQKIKFLTIVFTIMFFTGNLCAQEVIKNTYTGENIVLTEQQKMWVNKAENEGYLLAVSNNWWNIENYYYNVQQKTITADRIYHTVLYGLILIGLFLMCFGHYLNNLFLMAFNTTFTFSKQKLENKEQWKIFTYLAILSCFLAIVADVSPDMKMGFYLSLMLGVAASFAALIGFSLYHTAIASFLLTILVSRVSVQIGFIECFTQIIFPIMVWMAAFLLLKAAIDYQRKPKRLTTLDLE